MDVAQYRRQRFHRLAARAQRRDRRPGATRRVLWPRSLQPARFEARGGPVSRPERRDRGPGGAGELCLFREVRTRSRHLCVGRLAHRRRHLRRELTCIRCWRIPARARHRCHLQAGNGALEPLLPRAALRPVRHGHPSRPNPRRRTARTPRRMGAERGAGDLSLGRVNHEFRRSNRHENQNCRIRKRRDDSEWPGKFSRRARCR